MTDRTPQPSPPRLKQPSIPLLVFGFVFYIFCAAFLLLLLQCIVRSYRVRYRGVASELPPAMTGLPAIPWGVNVSLEQYDEAEAHRALQLIREAGFQWVRQRFPWEEIEPAPGSYRWEKWDHLVKQVRQYDLSLLALLDRTPRWARDATDIANPFAPPQDITLYASWVAACVTRYSQDIQAYQIWDEPNIWPHWGERPTNPEAYVRLLSAAYQACKSAHPEAWVIAAGLAPNAETGGRNMSDVLYLQKMYDAGAAPYFDILGAKPYGFWSGPEDRRVNKDVLNYSRLILLREEMIRRGDEQKAIWAVEMGWNALPSNWAGQAAPWGTDSEEKQADRTVRALQRAGEEWPWLGLLCLQHFQPKAEPDDPIWGFSLVDQDFRPRLLYEQVKQYLATPSHEASISRKPKPSALFGALALLTCGLVVFGWRGYTHFRQLPWKIWWQQGAQAFYRLSDKRQAMLIGLAIGVYFFSPPIGPALLSLWLILAFSYLRLDWTLLYATLSIPFALYHRRLGSMGFSLIEMLTLLLTVAWGLQALSQASLKELAMWGQHLASRFRIFAGRLRKDWRSLDGAWAFFLIISVFSLLVSKNLAVSLREFRVVVLESALFYFLIARCTCPIKRDQATLLRFSDALVLSGTVIALHGLVQYFGGGDVIVTEGVRRIRGLYGSPNNLSLLLGRILPLAIALAFWGRHRRRRIAYTLGIAIMLPCLFLTYSRGAWLLGLPAALLFLGALRGRRAMLVAVTASVISILALIPLTGTERIASLLDASAGTTLFRVELWRSSLAMIRDHPITGVGLDNFLYYYQEYILPEAAAEPYLSHPHNIVLDYWTRLGIGGLIALVWFMAAFFRRGATLYRRLPEGDARVLVLGLMASMVDFLAHGLVDNSYFVVELAFIFALTLGLIQRLESVEEKNR